MSMNIDENQFAFPCGIGKSIFLIIACAAETGQPYCILMAESLGLIMSSHCVLLSVADTRDD